MKPSERIKEIYFNICEKAKCEPNSEYANTYGYYGLAMSMYLDEEWEKKHRHPEGIKCNEC